LIELLVKYNIAHFYPQLKGCSLVKELQSKRELMYEAQVLSWQEQRGYRIQKIVEEYNDKGWVL
jgi:hypothetical protein